MKSFVIKLLFSFSFVQFDLKLQRLEKELRLFKYAFDLQQRMKENNDNRKLSLREDDPLAFKNKKTFKKIVWNGETKEFLCRTWLSWGENDCANI